MEETANIVEKVRYEFRKVYGAEPRLFRAPGRVNLIGEHTDYNDGFVLPAAIDREVVMAAEPRDDGLVNITALDKGESVQIDLSQEGIKRRGSWIDYVEGTIRTLQSSAGISVGANLLFSSTVPIGSGLSSSAAIEVSTGFAMLSINGGEIDLRGLAFSAQKAEHEYVGTRSGIMDQFAASFGREGHAILLDCRDLSTRYVPVELPDAVIAVCDSGVHHELASSEYNQRRAECDQAVAIFRNHLPEITSLRDLSTEQVSDLGKYLTPVLLRRSIHVVSENDRTLKAANALSDLDLARMGELMFQSHESLRFDYEVSCAELDELVDIARETEGVFGSRMTGGGFGGCTVSIVATDAYDDFCSRTAAEYKEAFGFEPSMFQVRASAGVSEI